MTTSTGHGSGEWRSSGAGEVGCIRVCSHKGQGVEVVTVTEESGILWVLCRGQLRLSGSGRRGMLNRRSVPMGEDQHECSKDERFTICTRRPWWLGPGQRKVAHSVYHLIFFFLNVGGSVILEMSILF